MNNSNNTITYEVTNKVQETHDVWTLFLKPKLKTKEDEFTYQAGQFITIYFPESGTPEGKAYSFSSAPHEKDLTITIKKMGDFSTRLTSMEKGDSFVGSLPYGYFSSDFNDIPLVLIAAGIGVTPFRSIILDTLEKNPQRRIILFCSNRVEENIIFKDLFTSLERKYPNFLVTNHITSTAQNRIPEIPILPDQEFLLCGSISFVRDIWKHLKERGASEDQIYTEAFFSH